MLLQRSRPFYYMLIEQNVVWVANQHFVKFNSFVGLDPTYAWYR